MQEHLQSTSPVLRGSCKIAVLLQGQSCWTQGKRKKVLWRTESPVWEQGLTL
ncbi:RIKEN cDNA 4930483J18 [Mus musculus]|nr:RIKEN cDNA 4930483J18 [Mus musculus]